MEKPVLVPMTDGDMATIGVALGIAAAFMHDDPEQRAHYVTTRDRLTADYFRAWRERVTGVTDEALQ